MRLIKMKSTLTSLFLQQKAVDGAGGAGHVGQRDLPQESSNTKSSFKCFHIFLVPVTKLYMRPYLYPVSCPNNIFHVNYLHIKRKNASTVSEP